MDNILRMQLSRLASIGSVLWAVLTMARNANAASFNQDTVYNFSSKLPYTALDFFSVPFAVLNGVAEVQIDHRQADSNTTNILDWGLADPFGQVVGWGGGNAESAIVGCSATSRSYNLLPTSCSNGYLVSGNWSVVVGKPRIATPPGSYSINITLRDSPSLTPQQERSPYAPSPPLRSPGPGELAWYAGDFHVHSRESGDAFANATLDEIAAFAQSVGLDFVHFSEHNTVSTSSFIVDAQSRHGGSNGILLLPGVEFTTYHGHAGALFTTQFVDFRIGHNGTTIQGAVDAVHAQGGLFSVNHMNTYEPDSTNPGDHLRNACVGCTWDYGWALSASQIDAMEIGVQSWAGTGFLYSPQAIEHWDAQHALGFTNIAPIGGSDDHHGGQEETTVGNWLVGSPIGSPTTMVLAANLSHAAIYEGVKLGRTVVKMFNNAIDPMVDLIAQVVQADGDAHDSIDVTSSMQALRGVTTASTTSVADTAIRIGGTVSTTTASTMVQLTATVTLPSDSSRASSHSSAFYLQLVRNNEQTFTAAVVGTTPFLFNVTVPVPLAGTDRWRAEVHDEAGTLHTITNHIFIAAP